MSLLLEVCHYHLVRPERKEGARQEVRLTTDKTVMSRDAVSSLPHLLLNPMMGLPWVFVCIPLAQVRLPVPTC
jgi:hypothetical protein